MNTDDKKATDEINELAAMLFQLDKSDNFARIKTIETNLVDKMLNYIKLGESNGKAYSKKLGLKYNSKLPFDDVYDCVTMLMVKLIKKFDSSKGAPFVATYFMLLKLRLVDIYDDLKKRGELVISREEETKYDTFLKESLEEHCEIYGEAGDFPDESDSTSDIVENRIIVGFVKLAPLISEYKKAEEHLSKSRRNFFESFFTYYLIESLHISKEITAQEIVNYNSILFPAIDIKITDYLLDCLALNMLDISRNPIKDEQLFKKRYEIIAICHDITRQTVEERYKRYLSLKNNL
jgi:DNA-directed RNA polymerase specialized sigma subunit